MITTFIETIRFGIQDAQKRHLENCYRGLVVGVCLVSSGLSLSAQVGSQDSQVPAVQADAYSNGSASTSEASRNTPLSGMALPAESLGADDLLEITVPYCPELSGKFRVGSDGTLGLPLLSQPIQALGRTPAQVAVLVKEALLRQQILADPSVHVVVLEYRSRTVIVLGAVLHPLTFQATGGTRLLDALAMAGGLSPTAGKTILVVARQSTPQGETTAIVRTVTVQDLFANATPADNVALHGGEEIRVSEIGKVFVTGNVVHPGMYAMQADGDTTVLKALALSQGLQAFTTSQAFIYRRAASGGDRQEIPVPLSKIIARKDRDVPLLADDILYVPEAKGRRMTAKVLNQITGFGQTTATGLLIYK